MHKVDKLHNKEHIEVEHIEDGKVTPDDKQDEQYALPSKSEKPNHGEVKVRALTLFSSTKEIATIVAAYENDEVEIAPHRSSKHGHYQPILSMQLEADRVIAMHSHDDETVV